jgi:hypothetical protein
MSEYRCSEGEDRPILVVLNSGYLIYWIRLHDERYGVLDVISALMRVDQIEEEELLGVVINTNLSTNSYMLYFREGILAERDLGYTYRSCGRGLSIYTSGI